MRRLACFRGIYPLRVSCLDPPCAFLWYPQSVWRRSSSHPLMCRLAAEEVQKCSPDLAFLLLHPAAQVGCRGGSEVQPWPGSRHSEGGADGSAPPDYKGDGHTGCPHQGGAVASLKTGDGRKGRPHMRGLDGRGDSRKGHPHQRGVMRSVMHWQGMVARHASRCYMQRSMNPGCGCAAWGQ